MTLSLYRIITSMSGPFLTNMLKKRLKDGKEDAHRWTEKTGIASKERPSGTLIWLHAASVGEAQSSLILMQYILDQAPDTYFLVTSGTISSAEMLETKLPKNCIHQYTPLDHPAWIKKFLDYWKPDMSLRIESEIWPNTLLELKKRAIPSVLVNARLSPESFKKWNYISGAAEKILSCFNLILCQTEADAQYFKQLGAHDTAVQVTGNIKYSAEPLPCEPSMLKSLQHRLVGRTIWIYASSHYDEESLAARLHVELKKDFPNLLTIIAPRHPERGNEIMERLASFNDLVVTRRGKDQTPPQKDTDIYLADTMGELGLFYRLAPVACIGRCFSADGGGGHNPLEPAQLGATVIYGPNVQNLQALYDDMRKAGAATQVYTEDEFYINLRELLLYLRFQEEMREASQSFALSKTGIIHTVMDLIAPYLPGGVKDHAA